ncbi:protein of unknown function DUF362 [Methanohalobium evestigatum Z-7303]|uniref:DUF362 domain-containing protein n=1 Tax=Methanohalobium evestigatum (strain ATCC BAA-1072 / DSM 3721 / NBRC 107634 / OCM 161 / Z-7303) TaxID=644295 RepID=D7E7P4_METEZ|nr:DUF362 domain-containing protein [Methanohalobium evestigatum]ADI74117.1 protein of unknown function DUF362 [Methanohalobium evestigatum Z-7303]
MSQVSVLKTSPETVLEDYSKLMRSVKYQDYLPKDKTTIIKLNLSWSLYYPACSTEPWQLEAVLKTLKEDGYKDIVAMENKTVVTNPIKGAKQNKWLSILDKYDVDFVPLTDVKWLDYNPSTEMVGMDKVFPDGFQIPEPFIGANVLHLPTQKTHGHTTITGAMKNAFGGLLNERRHHSHKYIHEVLVDLLKIQKEIHPGIFAVMDGTVCGDGAGPRTMTPKIKDYILASYDQVSIDAVSAKMMGFDPMSIDKIKMADELGLGSGNLDNIKIVGEDISDVNYNFEVGESLVVSGDKLFRKGGLKFLEPLLFHTPLFKIPILASSTYHDRFWYPVIGKKYVNEFMETKWGKLFSKY